MTDNEGMSKELALLADFAEREDWLYQAELRFAEEVSAIAIAFAKANPGSNVFCENYIGKDSALRLSARSSILKSIRLIEKSLNKAQGIRLVYTIGEVQPDYFAGANPAKSFFQSEIVRRNLQSFS